MGFSILKKNYLRNNWLKATFRWAKLWK